MTDASQLAQLKDRIEKAEGPFDVSPREIFEALGFEIVERKYIGPNLVLGFKEYTSWEPRGFRWGILGNYDIIKFTDAAIALVEKMLPGCGYGCSLRWPEIKRDPAEAAHGWIHHGDDTHEGDAATPALALLSALLKAIQAKGERDGE